VPLVSGDRLIGVLDVDSPTSNRFNAADAALLERLAAQLVAASDWRLAGIDGFNDAG
jgi:GAF domain-containing protein